MDNLQLIESLNNHIKAFSYAHKKHRQKVLSNPKYVLRGSRSMNDTIDFISNYKKYLKKNNEDYFSATGKLFPKTPGAALGYLAGGALAASAIKKAKDSKKKSIISNKMLGKRSDGSNASRSDLRF